MKRLANMLRRGFTLVELIVAMALVAILAALALPSFIDSLRAGCRADGVAALTQLQQAEERWRAEHADYAGSLTDLGVAARSARGLYALAIQDAGNSRYVLTATATASQAGDRRCSVLKLAVTGGELTYSSLDADGHETASTPNRCWGGA